MKAAILVMKAAILEQPGKLEIREVETPECPPGGVLVKVNACGICSSDAKMVAQGHRALNYPRIPGHEIAGIIEQSRTNTFKEGTRIQSLKKAPGFKLLRGFDAASAPIALRGWTICARIEKF